MYTGQYEYVILVYVDLILCPKNLIIFFFLKCKQIETI